VIGDFYSGHFSRKKTEEPGNVGEFDSCHGKVRELTESQENVMEKILLGKTIY